MSERLLYLYCRVRTGAAALGERAKAALWPPQQEWEDSQAGLSKLAITVILVAVGVALTLAVVAVLGPRIMNLANRTGDQIDSVPMDWGE